MPRPTPTLLLATLALLLAACSDRDGAPRAGIDSTFHLLTFSRLQGFAEGVPYNPDEPAPLPAAYETARELSADGSRVILGCVGDAVFWGPSVTQHKASQVGARGRSEALLAAMKAAGVEVYVPGFGDFLMGYASHLERVREAGVPVLVSNLEVEGFDDVIQDRMVIEHDGVRLGLLGLIPATGGQGDMTLPDAELATLTAPAVAAAEKVRQLREEDGVHIVLVYSNLSQQTNGEIAKIEGVRFVLGSSEAGVSANQLTLTETGAGLMTMRTQGRELALTTIDIVDGSLAFRNLSERDPMRREIAKNERDFAKYSEQYGTTDHDLLARSISPHNPQLFYEFLERLETDVAWLAEADAYEGTSIEHHRAEMRAASPDNPVWEHLARQGPATNEALDRMTRLELEPIDFALSIPRVETCVSCHADQVAFWEGTDHARAMDSLRELERQRDGSCLICHAVGYRETGGFNDVRLEDPLGPVTCFNCHEANQVHVVSPRGHLNPRHFDGVRDSISERCERCHTGRRDHDFDLERDLEAVACPPMRVDDPALVQARNTTLARITELRAAGNDNEFDHYLEARALLGLGRRAEAVDAFVRYAEVAETEEVLPIMDAAGLLERAGDSRGSVRVLEAALLSRPGEPFLNMLLVRLLLEAEDESVRNPSRAVATIEHLLPPEIKVDYRTLDMRKVQVQAYFAAGFSEQGESLLRQLRNKYPGDDDLIEMMSTYGLR